MKVQELLERVAQSVVQIRDETNRIVIAVSPNSDYEKYLSTWLLEREIIKIKISANGAFDVCLEREDKQ